MGRSKKQQNREVKPSKFKTTLCQFYIKGEECPFGEKCAFAHGDQELRDETENDTDRHTPNNSGGGTEGGDASPATSSLPSMVRVPPSVPNEALIIAKPIGSWSVPSSANELWALGLHSRCPLLRPSPAVHPEYDYFADRGWLLFLPNLNDGEGNVH